MRGENIMTTAERNAMIKEIYEKDLLESLYREVIESEQKKFVLVTFS